VESTLPYLARRAKENTAIAGQMSKELEITVKERRRTKSAHSFILAIHHCLKNRKVNASVFTTIFLDNVSCIVY